MSRQMSSWRKSIALLLFVIILCMTTDVRVAFSEENKTNTLQSTLGVESIPIIQTTSNTLGSSDIRDLFFDDVMLRGNSTRFDSYIEIGKGQRNMEGSYVDLFFSYSPELLPDHSFLTLLVNDIPVDSIALDNSDAKEHHWTVDITGHQLGPGYHKLSLVAQMRTTNEQACEDPLNDQLWLVAYQKSKVALQLAPVYEKADLTWYPSPFIERGGIKPLQSIIVVPDQINQEEFVVSARLSQFFASQAPNNHLYIPIYVESDVTEDMLNNSNVIWIGQINRWHNAGLKMIMSSEEMVGYSLKDQNLIVESASPWNSSKTQLFITGDEEHLRRASEILTTETLYRQLQGNVVSVSTVEVSPDVSEPIQPETQYTITLQDLNFNNLKTENVMQGSIQFQYSIPTNWDLAHGADLNLSFKHSKSILFDKSIMTVKVNGIPVESVRLVERTSDNGLLDVHIDPAVVGSSRSLSIEVVFQFANPAVEQNMDREFQCSDTLLGNWATVDSGSSLNLTFTERQAVNLQTLPYPFVADEKWQGTVFLTPRMGTEELQLAMTLIGKLGAGITDVSALQFELTSASNWMERLEDQNIIYLGTSSELPQSLNGFKDSFVRFEKESIYTQSNHVQLLDPLERDFAIIQISRSPLSVNHYILMLVARNQDRLSDISRSIVDSEEVSKLTGNFVAIDQAGAIYAFSGTENTLPIKVSLKQATNERWDNFTFSGYVFALILLLILLAVIAIAYYYNHKQRK